MRHLLAAALLLVPAPSFAAEVSLQDLRVAGFDATSSDFAREVTARISERLKNPPAMLASDWEVTIVGNVTYLRDANGTHGCSNPDLQTAFSTCMEPAINGFYAANPTANPDFLAAYLAWDIGQFFAFYSPQANDVRGIGMKHFAGSDTFGDMSGLQGFIFMNSVQLYDLAGPSQRQLIFDLIWGQEVGHRWGSFIHFDDKGEDNDDILGRDDSHWSWYLDTDWSWMEGNDWKDNGNGTFTTDFDTFGEVPGYSPLDLYIMGLIPPSAVPDLWYIEGSTSRRSDPPAIMNGSPRTIEGTKKTFTIDQVIEIEGVRQPAWVESPRRWQTNLLVILRQEDSVSSTLQQYMTQFEQWTRDDFSRDTSRLAAVDTTIGAMPPNGAPDATFTIPDAAKKGEIAKFDASGSTDPDGDSLAYVWDFGDGEGAYGENATVEHEFRRSGDLVVTLTVVDRNGARNATEQAVTVAAADDKGGCGCTLAPAKPGSLAPLALLALAMLLVRRRT